jgi:hypothetical protein
MAGAVAFRSWSGQARNSSILRCSRRAVQSADDKQRGTKAYCNARFISPSQSINSLAAGRHGFFIEVVPRGPDICHQFE